MNSVYVDNIYIGKSKHLKAVIAGGTDQGPVAMGDEL